MSKRYTLSTLSGTWTTPRLKKIGMTEADIGDAQRQNVITKDSHGLIRSVRGKAKLLESTLAPGSTVVRIVDGHPVEFMVVRDDNGKVQLVNPEDGSSSQTTVERNELLTPEETDEQTQTTPPNSSSNPL